MAHQPATLTNLLKMRRYLALEKRNKHTDYLYLSSLRLVQSNFLFFAAFLLKVLYPYNYKPARIASNLFSLTDSRRSVNISFIQKLLSNVIDYPTLLSRVSFKVPPRPNRYTPSFLIPFSSSNYLANSPIKCLIRIANEDSTFNYP